MTRWPTGPCTVGAVRPAGFVVLAHEGGWDEALLVLLPVAIFAGLLWLGNRRARRQGRDAEP